MMTRKLTLPLFSLLLLGGALFSLYAEEPGQIGQTACDGSCVDANAKFTADGWVCKKAHTDYACEKGDVSTYSCTECMINEATAHLSTPKCRCKIVL